MTNRRDFLKSCAVAALTGSLVGKNSWAFVPAHNWDGYNFGSGPTVYDRLNQGPFPIYPPETVVPGSSVVMATFPSDKEIHNYGMGMVVYVCDEKGPPVQEGRSLESLIEDLVKLELGQKLYLRLDWKDIQKKPGRLDFCDHWKISFDMAEKYNKRIGFRIQLASPVIPGHSVPDFLAEKIPFVELGKTDRIGLPGKIHAMPRYDHPEFLAAFKEMDDMLSEIYDGHPLVEFVDTAMYGFWGEGHSWPFSGNPFPDYITAEKTFVEIFEHQAKNWSQTPLVTNTQPDYSRVGNSEVLDRTVRSHNWMRTDTIYIENMQVESLSNRPPWIAGFVEKAMSDGTENSLRMHDGIPATDRVIAHIIDIGANYMSLWNHSRIRADRIMNYYRQYPDMIDLASRKIGYRVRPSWVWSFEKDGHPGLVFGMVNDGISGVPGILRLTVFNNENTVNVSGCLDPGYPLPGKVRQAMVMLPKNTNWNGLKVKAELEVKGMRYPVEWACREATNPDGSLTLLPTAGV